MNGYLKDKFGNEWCLDSKISYLNHGSFGARPLEIVKVQQAFREKLESSPVDFLDRCCPRLLEEARSSLSSFICADESGLGFVSNATTGVSAAIHAIPLEAGDEILTTDQVYNGVRQLLLKRSIDTQSSYREIKIPFPLNASEEITRCIEEGINQNTKVLVVDHVTSASAIIFPVEQIVKICRKKGILVLIDGAHAPGMIQLDINAMQPDWYVGNLHKWVCAPLGAGFIWTDVKQRPHTHPLTVSHFLNQGYTTEFDWQGTRDVTSWLTVPFAIQWLQQFPLQEMIEHNHSLATYFQQQWTQLFGVDSLSPLDGSMIGNMATVKLPSKAPQDDEGCLALRDLIFSSKQIEFPIFQHNSMGMARFSGQVYIDEEVVKKALFAISEHL